MVHNFNLSLRPAWSTYQVPGWPELHTKTLVWKKEEEEEEVNKSAWFVKLQWIDWIWMIRCSALTEVQKAGHGVSLWESQPLGSRDRIRLCPKVKWEKYTEKLSFHPWEDKTGGELCTAACCPRFLTARALSKGRNGEHLELSQSVCLQASAVINKHGVILKT